ncbi:unnamed protein product [Moneuplotes crassus]|uniref:Uncharacterized protein n=1 Tax=Euplotes crassus TaxID=5936 RepID=A0AAD1XLS1_EUPCR|nr:unnamed protein product [Moneuplotes crassus]
MDGFNSSKGNRMDKGFRVAVSLLENQLKELRRRKQESLDDQSRLYHKQRYEVQALQEILDERVSTIYRLQEEYRIQQNKYTLEHNGRIKRIKAEAESKLDVIYENHEEGKLGMIHLVNETENALKERLEIIEKTKSKYSQELKSRKKLVNKLKCELETLNYQNEKLKQNLVKISENSEYLESKFFALREEYNFKKRDNGKIERTHEKLTERHDSLHSIAYGKGNFGSKSTKLREKSLNRQKLSRNRSTAMMGTTRTKSARSFINICNKENIGAQSMAELL